MKTVTFETRGKGEDWATWVNDNDDSGSETIERLKSTDFWSVIEGSYKNWVAAKRPAPAKLAADEAARKAEVAAAAAAADKKARDEAAAAAKKAEAPKKVEEPKHPSTRGDFTAFEKSAPHGKQK